MGIWDKNDKVSVATLKPLRWGKRSKVLLAAAALR
jgi:hypothetical protein